MITPQPQPRDIQYILQRIAPQGSLIISSKKQKLDGEEQEEQEENSDLVGYIISFCAVRWADGKFVCTDIDKLIATLLGRSVLSVPHLGEGVFLSGNNYNHALELVRELALRVWENEQAFIHYAM